MYSGGQLSTLHRKTYFESNPIWQNYAINRDAFRNPTSIVVQKVTGDDIVLDNAGRTFASYSYYNNNGPFLRNVLSQVRSVARSLRRRKVNSPITAFADIEELTPETLRVTIERIEVGHVTKKSRIGSVVKIQWKLA